MFQVFALAVVIIGVAALMLVVVFVTRAALDKLDRLDEQRRGREERPAVPEAPDAWRQWTVYYHSLAEQARAEGNVDNAATYVSLAETYSVLAGGAV